MSKTKVLTTKEDIIKLIKLYPTVQSKKELAEKVGKNEEWLTRIIPYVRNAGVDLPKFKSVRAKLKDIIAEALKDIK